MVSVLSLFYSNYQLLKAVAHEYQTVIVAPVLHLPKHKMDLGHLIRRKGVDCVFLQLVNGNASNSHTAGSESSLATVQPLDNAQLSQLVKIPPMSLSALKSCDVWSSHWVRRCGIDAL